MKHDKGLLKADKLAAFREWLVAAGFEVRDGKGEFQCLQVKTSPTCWAVVGRNTAGVLPTHPELRTLINRFNSGGALPPVKAQAHDPKGEAAFKNFHRSLCERFGLPHDPVDWWRDQSSLEEHIASLVKTSEAVDRQPSGQFLEDLRDDFAMHALQGQMQREKDFGKTVREQGFGKYAAHIAQTSYQLADAMLEARKSRQ